MIQGLLDPDDDLVSLAPFADHLADDEGRVLQIGVQRDDGIAPGVVKTGDEHRLVAEVPAHQQPVDARVHLMQRTDQRLGSVGAAVVHKENLPGGDLIQRFSHRLQEPRDTLFLVEDRHHQGNPRQAGRGGLLGRRHVFFIHHVFGNFSTRRFSTPAVPARTWAQATARFLRGGPGTDSSHRRPSRRQKAR